MIVRDEERFLAEALESVRGVVDEICIVDTGSQDRTPEIARSAGARVREIAWEDDFAKARNAALEMATRRWIFVLDADERLAPRSRDVLAAIAACPAYLTGFWVRCFNFAEDYKGTGAMSHALVRLFPNHERIRYRNRVHEIVALDGSQAGIQAVRCAIDIIHLGYTEAVMRERRKGERNLAMTQAALKSDPADPFNWYNYAASALLAGQAAAARAALEKMRELVLERAARRPDGGVQAFVPNGLSMLATQYLAESQPARAEELAREILRIAPTLPDAHFLLGKALAAQRRFKDARDAFAAAIKTGADSARHPLVDNEVPLWKAHSEIGATLMEEGGYELALAWFDLALKARPKVQPVRLNRARALERLGRFQEACDALAATWADDRDGIAANEYVNFLLRRGDDGGALGFIEEAAPQLPGEQRLIFYGSAAAIAWRAGLPGTERYLSLARSVEDLDHVPERLAGLLRGLGASGALEPPAAKTAS